MYVYLSALTYEHHVHAVKAKRSHQIPLELELSM